MICIIQCICAHVRATLRITSNPSELHCFLGACGEVICQESLDTTFLDNLHTLLDISAFQTNHQRLDRIVATNCLNAGNHSFGNVVTASDASEDVDEDRLDIR